MNIYIYIFLVYHCDKFSLFSLNELILLTNGRSQMSTQAVFGAERLKRQAYIEWWGTSMHITHCGGSEKTDDNGLVIRDFLDEGNYSVFNSVRQGDLHLSIYLSI